jgi:UDP-galactopyranose mutase
MEIVIIGAGLTGLSAGFHLKDNYVVYEGSYKAGGLAGSYVKEGFIFDHAGVHVLRTTDNLLRGESKAYYDKFILDLLKNDISKKKKMAYIYLKGNYHLRPFQHNLHGASKEVIDKCVDGINNIEQNPNATDDYTKSKKTFANFKEELLGIFGKGLCNYFMFPYNEKAWCYDLSKIKSKIWISKNFGSIFDPIRFREGVLYPNEKDQKIIKYPKYGGFGGTGMTIYNKIEQNVNLNSKITKIDLNSKEVEVNNSFKTKYKHLISTIPIPELIKLIDDAPLEVKEAAQGINYSSMFSLNIGVDKEKISDMQYIYYPDRDVCFTRVSFPVNQAQSTAPKGKTGVCVEVPYSRFKPLDKNIVEMIMNDLIKVGVFKGNEKILFKDEEHVKYSYVVQDLNLEKNMKIMREFLLKHDIHSIGRYGEWKHSGTEHAIDDGRRIAQKLRFNG